MSEVTVRQLKHTYSERTVVDIDDLFVAPGEIVAIVGPSGAGKSTLMRLIALLERPTTGTAEVRLNGASVTYDSVSIDERRKMVMVFQRPSLLSRSVYDNVAYPLRLRGNRNGHKLITHALERVSMLPLADSNPGQLSGGELQRVALARALVLNPALMVLDEPTANLDPANIRIIEGLIREQNAEHGTTMLIVTHNIFQAKRLAHRVGLMIGGKLIEITDTETFFNNPTDPRTRDFVAGDLIY